nr:MAG TPA: hypothetical protein [Caudoviricetes sp.]
MCLLFSTASLEVPKRFSLPNEDCTRSSPLM